MCIKGHYDNVNVPFFGPSKQTLNPSTWCWTFINNRNKKRPATLVSHSLREDWRQIALFHWTESMLIIITDLTFSLGETRKWFSAFSKAAVVKLFYKNLPSHASEDGQMYNMIIFWTNFQLCYIVTIKVLLIWNHLECVGGKCLLIQHCRDIINYLQQAHSSHDQKLRKISYVAENSLYGMVNAVACTFLFCRQTHIGRDS
jgi:hypothetical protein